MICSKCGKEKSEDDFPWKKLGVKKNVQCKDCCNTATRSHYARNKLYYYERNKRYRAEIDKRFRFVFAYLQSHQCVDCGESNPIVLDFDHVTGDKKLDISSLLRRGFALQSIVDEISKCEVRCANCHRCRHAKEDNEWRYLLILESQSQA